MPLYDYHCTDCDTDFEVRKHMAEIDNPAHCPVCNSLETRRVIRTVQVFSRGDDGRTRVLAGAPICSTCGLSSTACTTCRPR
jgi:putative FmdB family regulatory protein